MMLVWFAETTLVATVLAAAALLAGRSRRLGPVARHALWLVVLIKLVAPPVVSWPWSARLARPARAVAEAPSGPGLPPDDVRGPSLRVPRAEAPARPDLALIGRGAIGVWGVGTAALALWQVGRVVRFRRRLRRAVPAPGWLAEEARRVGRRLGVRAPEILVVPGPTTPMLWFLGRPTLILPGRLVETLGAVGWRGILAHELAHVRRRDHWVGRLELAAGLLWWWNPLYWLTRRRLGAEAELACDEWAVRAFPEGRLAYAEALLEVCRSLPATVPPAPALGVAGAGRFLERRVIMILRDQAPSRASTPVLLGAGLLALLALPGWSASGSPAQKPDAPAAAAPGRGSSDSDTAVVPDDNNRVDAGAADTDEASDDGADAEAADKPAKGRKKSTKPGYPDARPDTKPDRPDVRPARGRKKSADLFGAPKPGRPDYEADRSDDRPAPKRTHPDARPAGKPEYLGDTLAKGGKKSADPFGAPKPGHPDAKPEAKPDRPKRAASEGRKVERRTRSRRITEMRALIDQLHRELKALEDEDGDGEDQ